MVLSASHTINMAQTAIARLRVDDEIVVEAVALVSLTWTWTHGRLRATA